MAVSCEARETLSARREASGNRQKRFAEDRICVCEPSRAKLAG